MEEGRGDRKQKIYFTDTILRNGVKGVVGLKAGHLFH
jgi:hypothetical protein